MKRSVTLFSLIFGCHVMRAEPIRVQHKPGAMHGFLLVKTAEGKVIGVGDLLQAAEGTQVRSRLLFRFRDGSIDDDTTVFAAGDVLRLVSDHHVQKGPSFPTSLDMTIDVPAAEVRSQESAHGKQEVTRKHMELPKDLANGMLPLILENISPTAAETQVSYLANDPKPRIVKLLVRPQGREKFSVGGLSYAANVYVIHIELGGIAGLVAPVIGKQPPDVHSWLADGEIPSFAKMEGPLYQGGPVWTIELTSPVWSSDTKTADRP